MGLAGEFIQSFRVIQVFIECHKGGLPYIAASGTTVYLAHQAGLAASGIITHIDPGVAHTILDQALTFQVTYGAVMLSFLGEPLQNGYLLHLRLLNIRRGRVYVVWQAHCIGAWNSQA
jgi:hypothetical protein